METQQATGKNIGEQLATGENIESKIGKQQAIAKYTVNMGICKGHES